MDLMVAGKWISGESHADVAFQFGVSPSTVKDWATSASRVIRLAQEGDLEDIRARSVATMEKIGSMALRGRRPDLRAAVEALKEKHKLQGLIVQKVDQRTRPSVAHLSREEHAAALDELEKEIAAEKKRIAEDGS